MSEARSRCPSPTRKGGKCPNRCAPGLDTCSMHVGQASSLGRAGGKARADRAKRQHEAVMSDLRLDTIERIRGVLSKALDMASRAGDAATMVRVASVSLAVLQGAEMEHKLAELRALLEGLKRVSKPRGDAPDGSPAIADRRVH